MVDYITKYLGSIRERRVIPDVKPGYMRQLLPEAAPTEPEDWENIFNDIEKVIMPGVSVTAKPNLNSPCLFSSLKWSWNTFMASECFPISLPRWFTGRALTCTPTIPVWLHGPLCSGICWRMQSTVLGSLGYAMTKKTINHMLPSASVMSYLLVFSGLKPSMHRAGNECDGLAV